MITRNGLIIEVYTRRGKVIPTGLLSLASGLQFTSGFPGGLYMDCSFYIPRELASYWNIRGAQRVVIRNGQRAIWEGKIDTLNNQASGGEQGTLVQCTGYWGALMMRYAIRKRWADTRITEDVWVYVTAAAGSPKCTVDRQNRIRFTPKSEVWKSNQVTAVRYTMPVGETVKRIKYSYAFAEAGQQWQIDVRRSTDGVTFTQMTDASGETYASGTTTVIDDDGAGTATGNIDVTLATPSRYIDLRYYAKADQTGVSDGTIYGEFSNITVFSETGAIDAREVGYDLIGACSELSSVLTGVYDGLSAETLPNIDILVFDEFTSLADIAMDVAGYGNTSDESLYFQVRSSEDDIDYPYTRPVLYAGIYPDLTSANYIVRLSDDNVVSADVSRSYADIKNWIAVNYTDERNEPQIITPDDSGYSLLTDATSVSNYGRRVESIQSGTLMTQSYLSQLGSLGPRGPRGPQHRPSSASLAYYYGKRYLAKWKDPLWSGSITVVGYILGSSGNKIPASEIEAGKVLDIADYVVDEVLATDTLDYPRVIITATSYDAESETCVISFGPLDDLKMIQIETMNFIPQATPSTGGTAAGGKGGNLNWKRRLGIEEGSEMWAEAVRLGKAGFKAKYPNWKKPKG
jgi:hypothetical protein